MDKEQNILQSALQRLVENNQDLAGNIISIYIYGSFITGEMSAKSDIDCFIVVKKVNADILSAVKILKANIEKEMGRELFVNIAAASDFSPNVFASGIFTHRERPYYFLFELKYCFRLFYGRDFISEIKFPEMMESRVKEECVRLVKNFQYINNKLVVNDKTSLYAKDAALKNILFSTKIIQIFLEYKFVNYKESTDLVFKTLGSPLPLLVYNLLKGKEEERSGQGISAADSITFYDLALEMMAGKLLSRDNIHGCLSLAGCLGYFSANKNKLSSGQETRVLIFLNGLPRPAQINELADYFAEQGFLFINLYYPGYWEAPGEMNFFSLAEAVISFARKLKEEKIVDLFSRKEISCNLGDIFLLGSSFGASVALSAQNEIFSKIVAVSPLINFPEHQKVIDDLFTKLEFFRTVVRLQGNGESKENFSALDQANKKLNLSADRILLASDENDSQINFTSVKKYADENQIQLLSAASGAHGYKLIKNNDILKQIFNFINN